MIKNGSAILILLLFISSILIPFHSITAESINIIYVDDDNTDGPWDGSIDHPFQYIQEGINASMEGDTVFVYEGFYSENLFINTSLSLQGEDRNTTIISAERSESYFDVISIASDEVCIFGFDIRDGDSGIYSERSYGITIENNRIHNNSDNGILLNDFSINCTIKNNVLQNNRYDGVGIYDASYILVTNNHIEGNGGNGIVLGSSVQINISANTFNNNDCGVYILGGEDTYTKIANNMFYLDGIRIPDSSNNSILKNRFEKASIGLDLFNSHYNKCISNEFINCSNYGMKIWRSNRNIIKNNSFAQCSIFLKNLEDCNNNFSNNSINNKSFLLLKQVSNVLIDENKWGQIVLDHCSNITIDTQEIDNTSVALQLFSCNDCVITDSTFFFNTIGIYVVDSKNIDILDTTIHSNHESAITCLYSKEITIRNNNVFFNNIGVYLKNSYGEDREKDNNIIEGNVILFNQIGIQKKGGRYTQIHYNQVEQNLQKGIILTGCNDCVIDHNNIIENKQIGVLLDYEVIIYFIEDGKNNSITSNNFIGNTKDALFLVNKDTTWDKNYWNTSLTLPHLIFGSIPFFSVSFPWIKFDWHPSSEPYDIDGGERL